jgi:Lrp/AsnC family leucine-responsive transcriptional regulator
MDAMDRKIVSVLMDNGRLSHEQIAREVHLSRPAVFERIKRLEAQGIIRGYGARVHWEALGLPLTAFVWIRASATGGTDCAHQVAGLSFEGGLLEDLHRVTGEWCMVAKLRLASPTALQHALDSVRAVPGIQSTMTTIALSGLDEIRASGTVAPLARQVAI